MSSLNVDLGAYNANDFARLGIDVPRAPKYKQTTKPEVIATHQQLIAKYDRFQKPKVSEVMQILHLDPVNVINNSVQPQLAKPLTVGQRFVAWIKSVFSAIAAFFRRIFYGNPEETEALPPTPVSDELNKMLNETLKTETDPAKWTQLVDVFIAKVFEGYDKNFAVIKTKIKFQILRIIAENPALKPQLDPLIARLGGIVALNKPALLCNKRMSCYADSLLQILFASKEFINHLKASDPGFQNSVATALKYYHIGLEAGLGSKDINILRDRILSSIQNLPEDQIGTLGGDVYKQQDVADFLKIIFSQLNISGNYGIKQVVTRTFANGYVDRQEEMLDQPMLPPVNMPVVKLLTLNSQQMEAAQIAQASFDQDALLERDIAAEAGIVLPLRRANKVKEWTDIINEQNSISFQHVLTEFFKQKPGELKKYTLAEKTKGKKDDVSDAALRSVNLDPEEYKKYDPKKKNAKLPWGLTKAAFNNQINGANKYDDKIELTGVAPPLLFIPLPRVNDYGVTNYLRVVLPANDIVTLPIAGAPVQYKVVGIAGGHVGNGGGHYVANAKIGGSWKSIDDMHPTANKNLASANDVMATYGRLYILEKVNPAPANGVNG